jgi:hypothetical protein
MNEVSVSQQLARRVTPPVSILTIDTPGGLSLT